MSDQAQSSNQQMITIALVVIAVLLAAIVGVLVWRSGVLEPGAFALTSWWALAFALFVLPVSLGIRALSLALLTNAAQAVRETLRRPAARFFGTGGRGRRPLG